MRLLTIALSLVSSTLLAADPQVLTVEEGRGGFLISPQITEYLGMSRQITVEVNGRAEVQTVTDRQPVTTPWPTFLNAGTGDFFDRAGRPLDPRGVAKLLKAGTVLAVSTDGSSIGPEVLKTDPRIAGLLVMKPLDQLRAGPAPKPLAPRLGTLVRGPDGVLYAEITVTTQVPTQQTRTRRSGGRMVAEVVTVQVPQTAVFRESLADARLTDLGGNPVDVKALRVGSRVAVAADFKPVDPSFLNELKGVVAVIVPREVTP